MNEDSAAVMVRPARPEDQEAVLAFCRDTWVDGDYIADVWDNWLAQETGVLLVAVVAGQAMGVIHLAMLSTLDAWIEGIRVDQKARRQGIGRVLTSQALVQARQRGAQVARLFTDSDNVASQELVTKKFGFQRVAEVVRYVSGALPSGADADADALLETEALVEESSDPDAAADTAPGPRLILAGAEDYTRLEGWLEHSNLAPLNGGLQFGRWNAWSLNEADLHGYLVHGDVWLLEEWEAIQALAVVGDMVMDVEDAGSPGTLQVRYIDGAASSIGTLALALREIAQEHELEQVELWLPDLLILQDAMNGAGYTRSSQERMLVYQRDL